MVAKLITLGYQVSVEDDSAITFTTINASAPSTIAAKSDPFKNTKTEKKENNKIPEDLSGLSIDELLNG